MELIMTAGDRLKIVRESFNLNQKEFADKIEITQVNLSRYENNKYYIPDETKEKLYQLGVNLNWLLTGNGDMFIRQEEGNELPSFNDAVNLLNDFAKLDAEGRMVVRDVIDDLKK